MESRAKRKSGNTTAPYDQKLQIHGGVDHHDWLLEKFSCSKRVRVVLVLGYKND